MAYNVLMFGEEIREHSQRVTELLDAYPDLAASEAGTKNSLIEPFLRCLGYDASHPEHVTPESPTELGTKIDYVLSGSAGVKIAVEAKKANVKLSVKETNQLRPYFTFSDTVAGVLTNGLEYWLFTDSDKTNVMDAEPYRRVKLRNLSDNDIRHLEALARENVEQGTAREQARLERLRRQVHSIVKQELRAPSPEFLRLVAKKAELSYTKANRDLLGDLVIASISRAVDNRPIPEAPTAPKQKDSQPEVSQPAKPQPTGPPKAILFGEPLYVNSHRAILIAVVKELQSRHSGDFEARVSRPPFVKEKRKWQYISTSEADFNPAFSTSKVGDYWLDTNHSAQSSDNRARLFLREFGYSPEDLVITTADD